MSNGKRFWVGGIAACGVALGVVSGVVSLPGCGSSSSGGGETSTEGGGGGGDDASAGLPPAQFFDGGTAACPIVVKRADCDPKTRPLVFVHGTYSSGTDIEHMAALLGSNGYCQDRVVSIDYDSVSASPSFTGGGVDSPGADCTGANTPAGCEIIDRAVNALLVKFPQFKQVDLAGHSQGTFHCGTYLAAHPDKIAHYINFSGIPNAGNIPTLSLSSDRDLFGSPHHATGDSICAFHQLEDGGTMMAAMPAATPGGPHQTFNDATGATDAGAGDGGAAACNVVQYTFNHQDHFAVAASKDSFVQVYKYLTGKDPQYTDIQCGDDPVAVEGIAERFADNAPINGQVKIREVTSTPQDTTAPTMDIMGMAGDTDGGTPPGHFGPVMLKRNVQYVFEGYDDKGKLVGWQYFTPFKRDNHLVRLLSPASSTDGTVVGGIVAGQSTDHAVASTGTTVIVARWAQGGFRQDLGASLKINGTEVLSTDNSGLKAGMSTQLQGGVAALFLEDANKNGKTDLALPYSTTFIAFTDAFISAAKPGFINMTFTAGSEDPVTVDMPIVVENYPSKAAADAGTADNHFVAVMFQ